MFAVLFPGQGAQFVGMGADLFGDGPDWLGEPANTALGWDLADLCLNGPEDSLTRTEHAQPALYSLSVALWQLLAEALRKADLRPVAMAGHSLGEYSALAAAGALSPEGGLRLVAERGEAMAQAADAADSGMAALMGGTRESAEDLCSARRDAGGSLWVANLNSPGQVVVAGGADDLEWAAEEARSFGIRRVIPLAVAGAFHTPFMDPARARLVAALETAEIGNPEPAVWSNVSAAPLTASNIRDMLSRQIVSPVRFEETLAGLFASGVKTFVHVGPGDVTAGLVRRTVKDATVVVVNEKAGIADAVDELRRPGTMPGIEET